MKHIVPPQVLSSITNDPAIADCFAFAVMSGNTTFHSDNLRELMERFQAPMIGKPFDIDTVINTVAMLMQRLTAEENI